MNYVFGNSHVNIFTGSNKVAPVYPEPSHDCLPWFRTFNIGAATAYSAKKHLATIRSILRELGTFDIKRDKIILVFGEVDIRMHIYIQARKQKKSVEAVVDDIAVRYLQNVQEMLAEGYKIVLFGCGCSAVRAVDDAISRSRGTVVERNAMASLFNSYLQKFCNQNKIQYMSLFSASVFQNGVSDLRYLDTDFMGEGNGLHYTMKMLPLLLWKCRDVGLIPFSTIISEYEV